MTPKPLIKSCLLTLIWVAVASCQANAESRIQFDLPPTAAAYSKDPADPQTVTVHLQLSSMIDVAHPLQVDQWIVRCKPRDSGLTLVDYAPRTETASRVSSPIQVKSTDESSNAFGAAVDGGYGKLASGHVGVDSIDKQTKTLQYDRVAPHQIVVASGTTHRGRGVYFKLRSTEMQVLEGEKQFSLTWQVPAAWRGCLLDVSVEAQVEQRSFTTLWERETKTIGSRRFVVAVYRAEDDEARNAATHLADAERSLRIWESKIEDSRSSFASAMRSLAGGWDQNSSHASWLQRLLDEQADPHLDDRIRKLPMEVRVAVIDYAEQREAFYRLNQL